MAPLYMEVRGSGPTLVLLHGWGLNLRVWDRLAAALGERLRIVAVDLPGHGRSHWLPERSSLEEQAAQVDETVSVISRRYSLLGWSFGAQIALRLAAQARRAPDPAERGSGHDGRPSSLERLVLMAATPRFSAAPDWPHGTPPGRLDEQAAGLRADYRGMVSDFLELLRDTDLRPLLGHIALPTLVIAGQYDRVTRPAASQALAAALPSARYIEIRRAAHAPFLSHLPELSTLLTDFLLPPDP